MSVLVVPPLYLKPRQLFLLLPPCRDISDEYPYIIFQPTHIIFRRSPLIHKADIVIWLCRSSIISPAGFSHQMPISFATPLPTPRLSELLLVRQIVRILNFPFIIICQIWWHWAPAVGIVWNLATRATFNLSITCLSVETKSRLWSHKHHNFCTGYNLAIRSLIGDFVLLVYIQIKTDNFLHYSSPSIINTNVFLLLL